MTSENQAMFELTVTTPDEPNPALIFKPEFLDFRHPDWSEIEDYAKFCLQINIVQRTPDDKHAMTTQIGFAPIPSSEDTPDAMWVEYITSADIFIQKKHLWEQLVQTKQLPSVQNIYAVCNGLFFVYLGFQLIDRMVEFVVDLIQIRKGLAKQAPIDTDARYPILAPINDTLTPQEADRLYELDCTFPPLWQQHRISFNNSLKGSDYCYRIQHPESGATVGYMLGVVEEKYRIHLARLVIEPQSRGMGFGERALQSFIRTVALDGYNYLTTNTYAKNSAAFQVYQKCGFEEFGSRVSLFRYTVPRTNRPN